MLNKPRMFINADDPLSLVFGGLPTFQGLPVLPLPDNDEVKIVKIDEGCIGRVTLQTEPCQACLDEGALCSSCEDDSDECANCGQPFDDCLCWIDNWYLTSSDEEE